MVPFVQLNVTQDESLRRSGCVIIEMFCIFQGYVADLFALHYASSVTVSA